MPDPVTATLAYYDQHAAAFAAQNAALDLTPLYERFLRHLPPGGRILDAGCGTGRDCLAFAERGYAVVGFDASAAMVQLSRARVGRRATLHHMPFEAVAWQAAFDGLWCCASLLHVPAAAFADVAARLVAALRPGGAWYLSFKQGAGEHWRDGRLFVDHSEASLRATLQPLPVRIADLWTSPDLRPGRERENWLNLVAIRTETESIAQGRSEAGP
ncbi:class I SAM-dependent methyltransferase [Roseomonas marmotae]|uniref:Class I SAM-dependent methyltransferase n=1 Tax=Roseomonas marmotae TaxID=2768161 RepID=A0ABS3KIH9_9PROT|nr:class I SAM-dependent methyltransferase [Roseomonas marmotae]MBO1077250.1 class I SAM-dependent methyltransferase [Roseomonas marmotae]QTI82096.1 class I SAM-dependent methyltransferase [Roseomonas marmotae]